MCTHMHTAAKLHTNRTVVYGKIRQHCTKNVAEFLAGKDKIPGSKNLHVAGLWSTHVHIASYRAKAYTARV